MVTKEKIAMERLPTPISSTKVAVMVQHFSELMDLLFCNFTGTLLPFYLYPDYVILLRVLCCSSSLHMTSISPKK